MNRHERQTITTPIPPSISSSDNLADVAQMRLRHQKAGLSQMSSPVQFQHFVLDNKAVQKLTPSLELFSKSAGRKMPLATVTPVQLYYFCSNKYKNSLLNKPFIHIWNISKEKASIAVSCHSYGSEPANEKLETPSLLLLPGKRNWNVYQCQWGHTPLNLQLMSFQEGCFLVDTDCSYTTKQPCTILNCRRTAQEWEKHWYRKTVHFLSFIVSFLPN